MKKLLSLFLAALVLTLSACGSAPATTGAETETVTETTAETEPATTETEPEEPAEVLSTDFMKVLGIAVDKSYKDKDGKPFQLVFLLYRLTTNAQNLKYDSVFTKMTINGVNTYSSEFLSAAKETTKFMPNFSYSSLINDLYIGEKVNVIATFLIPKAELASGRTIRLSDDQIPDIGKIKLSTDRIVYYDDGTAVAKAFDELGYSVEKAMRKEGSQYLVAERVTCKWSDGSTGHPAISVYEILTNNSKPIERGNSWWCYVNNITYKIHFGTEYTQDSVDHRFLVETSLGIQNGGSFIVTPKYIICTYDSNGAQIEIPYTLDEEKFEAEQEKYINTNFDSGYSLTDADFAKLIKIDLISAFSVYE